MTMDMFRKSAALNVDIHKQERIPDLSKQYCRVQLSKDAMGIHLIQFSQPVTEDNPYFCIEITKLRKVLLSTSA